MASRPCTTSSSAEGLAIFPVTPDGEVGIDGTGQPDPKKLREAIRLSLEVLGARRIEIEADELRFRSTVLRIMSSTNLLAPISYGRIRIARAPRGLMVRYRLNLWQVVVGGTLVFGLVLGLPLYHAPNLSTWQASVISAVAWLLLIGGNWALAALRFPRFIRACANAASNRGSPA